jgi:hypothetical protein
MDEPANRIIGFTPPTPPPPFPNAPSPNDYSNNGDKDDYHPAKDSIAKTQPNESQHKMLMTYAMENIELLFLDQFNDGFANVFVKDHCETIPLKGSRFKRFLSNIYYERTNSSANSALINDVTATCRLKRNLKAYSITFH